MRNDKSMKCKKQIPMWTKKKITKIANTTTNVNTTIQIQKIEKQIQRKNYKYTNTIKIWIIFKGERWSPMGAELFGCDQWEGGRDAQYYHQQVIIRWWWSFDDDDDDVIIIWNDTVAILFFSQNMAIWSYCTDNYINSNSSYVQIWFTCTIYNWLYSRARWHDLISTSFHFVVGM